MQHLLHTSLNIDRHGPPLQASRYLSCLATCYGVHSWAPLMTNQEEDPLAPRGVLIGWLLRHSPFFWVFNESKKLPLLQVSSALGIEPRSSDTQNKWYTTGPNTTLLNPNPFVIQIQVTNL